MTDAKLARASALASATSQARVNRSNLRLNRAEMAGALAGTEDAVHQFAALLHTCGGRGVSLDVGSNNGDWSRAMVQYWKLLRLPREPSPSGTGPIICRERLHGPPRLRSLLFEPQKEFRGVLEHLAARHGWEYYAAAVVGLPSASGRLNLSSSSCSTCVSSVPAASTRFSYRMRRGKPFSVPAIELAPLLANVTAGAQWSILKLDIEAGEYELLPRLMTSGALCRLTHLAVEWHLNALPPADRLNALALRLSFDQLLLHGCARPPFVQHHDYQAYNRYVEVPGLAAELRRHTAEHMDEMNLTKDERRHVAWSVAKWAKAHGDPTAPKALG